MVVLQKTQKELQDGSRRINEMMEEMEKKEVCTKCLQLSLSFPLSLSLSLSLFLSLSLPLSLFLSLSLSLSLFL